VYAQLGAAVPRARREIAAEEIRARTILPMINEAARILEEGIVRSAGDVDVGMITGTGFPPFRGGLLRHAESMGLPVVLARLESFARTHGERFEPARLLRDLVHGGRAFYA
jgi:3-hydroxyacyl-CoA dehydrogenase/enoyl-CoA hydratase/3-hydroxybutyryl-CoA epimerase